MITFLFAWLGSTIFWVAYAVATIFVGTYLLRRTSPESITFLRTGQAEYVSRDGSSCTVDNGDIAFEIVVIFIFWPVLLVVVGIWYLGKFIGYIFKHIVWGLVKSTILFADKNMPNMGEKKEQKHTGDDHSKVGDYTK